MSTVIHIFKNFPPFHTVAIKNTLRKILPRPRIWPTNIIGKKLSGILQRPLNYDDSRGCIWRRGASGGSSGDHLHPDIQSWAVSRAISRNLSGCSLWWYFTQRDRRVCRGKHRGAHPWRGPSATPCALVPREEEGVARPRPSGGGGKRRITSLLFWYLYQCARCSHPPKSF